MKLTKETTIGEILRNYTNAQEVLSQYGMHCFSCPMSQMESIEEAGMVHGYDGDELVAELNKKLIPNKEEKPTNK